MVQVIMHRASHTTRSGVEICCGNDRLILDLGLPLIARNGAELDKEAGKVIETKSIYFKPARIDS